METINTYLPFLSAAISWIFAAAVLRRYAVGRRPYTLLWGLGMVWFGLGTTTEALHGLGGWNPTVFRVWYLSGAMLTAAWLGQGTVYLLVRRGVAHVFMAVLLAVSVLGAFLIFQADLDPGQLEGDQLSGQAIVAPVLGDMSTPVPRLVTPFTNVYGTVALVGGAVYSAWIFWRKRILADRVTGNVLIALGALSPAWGGTLARLGQPAYLYGSELVGAVLMFLGFIRATAPTEETAGEPASEPAGSAQS